MSSWDNITNSLSLLPEETASDLFYFEKYGDALVDIIAQEKLKTPLTILIDGEWGSGKTSLLNNINEKLKKKKPPLKVILFNPWLYENLEPLACLMQTIVNEFKPANEKLKGTLKAFSEVSVDIALRKLTGVELEDVKKRFDKIVRDIPTIPKQVSDITKKERLIILVDDLDRCTEDNALKILNAIKLFFDSDNVIFVVAADIVTLQKAWELKYTKSISNLEESRKYFDKIFQLKISLPPKTKEEVEKFIRKKIEDFPEKEQNLILEGCPFNPRLITKLLNSLYFNVRLLTDQKFETAFPLLITWSITVLAYPSIAAKIKKYPLGMVILCYICSNHRSFKDFFFNVDRDEYNKDGQPVQLSFGRIGVPLRMLAIELIDCVMFIAKNRQATAFSLFKSLSLFYQSTFEELRKLESQEEILKVIKEEFQTDVENIVHKTTI